jgi:hypothetical protein
MAILLILSLSASELRAGGAEDPERSGELQPVTPASQQHFINFRNYGHNNSVALSPDGKTLIAGSSNALLLYDFGKTTEPRQPRYLQVENVNFFNSPLAISPDGKTAASFSAFHEDLAVRFWDLATGKEIHQIDNDQPLSGIAYSPDGKLLALGTQQHVELWDAVSGDEVRVFQGVETPPCRILAFTVDGRMLATAGMGPSIQLWEVASGKERARFHLAGAPSVMNPRFRGGNQNLVHALAISADNNILAVGTSSHSVVLWDLRTGQELPPLVGHQAPVHALRFTSGGKQLVSFDEEGLRLVWNARHLARSSDAKLTPLGETDFEELWEDLAEDDAFRTFRAVRYLTADPQRALPLLRRHLQPVPAGDSQRIAQLLADLQKQDPAARRKAMSELRKHGEAALGPLAQLAEQQQGNRTITIFLAKLEAQYPSADRFRALKAVQVLEQIGSANARQELDKLAKGAAGARLTVEAKAALGRLADRAGKGEATARSHLESQEFQALWTHLGSDDAHKAYHASLTLAAVPKQAVPWLAERLKPVPIVADKRIEQLIADLDSNSYPVRQKATEELEQIGEQAAATLKRVLAGQPSLETRKRVQQLCERLTPGQVPPTELLRALRAMEVLEHSATEDAKQVLERLAHGAPEARLTREAKSSLARLARRGAAPR